MSAYTIKKGKDVYYNPQNNKELAVFYLGLDNYFLWILLCWRNIDASVCMTGADETCSFSVVTAANFFRQSFI
jgi:hypothetical protein